jgi:hypothetical protein
LAEAADALIDCAWVANEAGHAQVALDVAGRALILSDTPALDATERKRLRERLGL